MAVSTWAVATLRCSAGVVDWKVDELKELDRKTRKMMTLHGALHPRSEWVVPATTEWWKRVD